MSTQNLRKRKHTYLCTKCQRVLFSLDSVLLVEEGQLKGFCSENCILSFYSPYMEYLKVEEQELRKYYNLLEEDDFGIENPEQLLSSILENPSEVWLDVNELGEESYSFIGEIHTKPNLDDGIEKAQKVYIVVMAFIFNQIPSLVIFHTITASEALLNEYKSGKKIEDLKEFLQKKVDELPMEEMDVPQEVIDAMEQKKSSLLADLIKFRAPSDIPIEDFHLYDNYVTETLQRPDEIYQYLDDEDRKVYTYIKYCEKDQISFYSFVICMKVSADAETEEDVLVPLISFPSLDVEMYKLYRKGEQMVGGLKN